MLKSRTVNIVFTLALLTVALSDFFGTVSIWLYVTLIVGYSLIQAYGATILSAQFFVPVKFQGEVSSNSVALTFDDGPIPGKTERILDILKRYEVPATFFCIGNRVKEHPQLVKRIYDEGHIVGNHSYWHGKTFDLQSAYKVASELMDTDEIIENSVGVRPKFFRPPYGVTNPMIATAVRQGEYTTIGWSLRSFDTMTSDKTVLMKRVVKSLQAGDVVLFHDYCESTIEMLPELLDHISTIGLKIARVDELLNEKAYV